jgi:surfactin synthase thioesterase subunit
MTVDATVGYEPIMPSSPKHPWLTCFRPRPAARRRLVCFGPAGGGPSFYRRWPDLLPTDVELLAVQLPGREARLAEPAAHSVESSAGIVAQALAEAGPRPTILFGHSMGALIAYETAHRLRGQRGAADVALVVSGREAPDRRMTDTGFMDLTDEAFLRYVAQRYGGIPIEVMQEPELRELIVPALRADFTAVMAYREIQHPPLDLPLVVLTGADDRQTTPETLQGWQARSSLPVRTRTFPGGHFYLVDHLEQVLSETLKALPL